MCNTGFVRQLPGNSGNLLVEKSQEVVHGNSEAQAFILFCSHNATDG